MKTALQYCGIAYLAVGLLLTGIRYVKRHGIISSHFTAPAAVQSDSSLGDVVLWPVTLLK